ncbi:MAG: sigma-54 dependent transcriptional regulator [Desulfobacterales bacterium]|jgi:DNA-binding NtrC family response regulator
MGSIRKPTILVVDDDAETRDYLYTLLGKDHTLLFAETAAMAKALFDAQKVDIVLLDIMLPDGNGLDLLTEFKEKDWSAEVIMITGVAEVDTAVRSMKSGAYDFLPKPFSIGLVQATVQRAINHLALQHRIACLDDELGRCHPFEGMVGETRGMKAVFELIGQYAVSDATVLIQGESGTGKELVARALHRQSHRCDHPLVVVNCAAIPANLMESTLFGHTRGAFTGAIKDKTGKLELADNGTVFLDDVDALEMTMQAKLLRAIQENEFERVGTNRVIKANIRFIAASNQDLQTLIREQRFREDLFFRLNVLPIKIPSLRERRQDISLLAAHFLTVYAEKRTVPTKTLTPSAMEDLEAYEWPGNVRELENLIQRLCTVVTGHRIHRGALPPPITGAAESSPQTLKDAVRIFEKTHIETVLSSTNGNRTQASKILGIHRNTLLAKINDLGIEM